MRYIVADKGKATGYGFDTWLHRFSATEMLLNEKEVIFSQTLTGDFNERVDALKGKILTSKEAIEYIKGWS